MSRKLPTRGVLRFVYAVQLSLAIQASGQRQVQDAEREFRSALAAKVQSLEKENAAACSGVDGWLFLSAELRFMSLARFWGADAVNVSRSPKPEWADPIPAIVDFNKQLKDRGIGLLLVPVPPKAEIYPDKIVPEVRVSGNDHTPSIGSFYDELRSQGVDVLDLAPSFLAYRSKEQEAVFCKTDTHWSGVGCVLAAQAIAAKIRAKVPELPSS
jgi:SGNH hydrolase-like domain, acetyltransferase AlgX